MSKMANHLHKYKKTNIARKKLGDEYFVYKCEVPGCTHYVPIQLSVGKLCECSRCHEPMIITKKTLNHSGGKPMLRPYCDACIKRKKTDEMDALADFLSKKI